MENNQRTAIIIGAGPAGLTAAYELLKRTDIKPIILEMSESIGGISRTERYKKNLIDVGPHRFFTKSQRVSDLWEEILPLQGALAKDDMLLGRSIPLSQKTSAPDPEKTDLVMLFKHRLTRIFFLKKFFDYPVTLSWQTIKNLGAARMVKIMISYFRSIILPIKKEKSLEDFFVNRFGRELYETFFKDYTEKVWGKPCDQITKEWGAQRIKKLSITKVLVHALKSVCFGRIGGQKKGGETSLTDYFYYPKLGAGQLYEEMGSRITKMGGEIRFNARAVGFGVEGGKVSSVTAIMSDGRQVSLEADYFISTMPIKELIAGFGNKAEKAVQEVARGLVYRDYIQVGLIIKKMKCTNDTNLKTLNDLVPDNWIYIQEREAKMGRLDIFNNFSLYMLQDEKNILLGAEYFCNEGDELWIKKDGEIADFAFSELVSMGLAEAGDMLDFVVIRQLKAYPAYFGTYDRLSEIVDFVSRYHNLFLIGRNGMHRYNNMDHSILSAMVAVDNIAKGVIDKKNIWEVNTEEEYHEQKEGK